MVRGDESDAALLRAWSDGDQAAGQQLVERHYRRIARFFRNNVADPADLIQHTFVACLEAAPRFREGGNFRAYLLGIAVNLLRQHYRVQAGPRNHARLDSLSVEDLGQSPTQRIAKREEDELLLAALRRLPHALQVVLELHYWEQLTTRELATVLGWPEGTVKDRLRRGRAQLKEHLVTLRTGDPGLVPQTETRLADWAKQLAAQAAGHGPESA